MRTSLFASLCLLSHIILAQPGSLDATFGNAGVVILQPGSIHDVGLDIVIAPDTTSYVVSQVTYQDTVASAVTHLLANGELDLAFGEGGSCYIHGGMELRARAIVRNPDGSLLVTGDAQTTGGAHQVLLAKVLPNGTLDTSFGTDGKVILPLGIGDDRGADLALDENGRIVVVGSSRDANNWDNSFILRTHPDGSLDETFSDDGKLFLTSIAWTDGLIAVALASDGTVFGAGSALEADGFHTLLVKADGSGQWDAGFGTGGYRVVPFSTGNDMAHGAAFQDGHLYVCGAVDVDTANTDGYIARFGADGSTDSAFHGSGVLVIDLNEADELNDLLVEPDGRVLACGNSGLASTVVGTSLLLVRALPNGTVDTDLDFDGVVTTLIGTGGSGAYGMAQQADEKILVTGWTWPDNSDLLVARYLGGHCDLEATISADTVMLCPGASGSLETSTPGQYQWYANGQAINDATDPVLAVDGEDAGTWFAVQVTDAGCAATSDSVLVDSYLFLLPTISNIGDAPNLIGDNGEQIYCQGDDPILVLNSPYDTNVQWSVFGEPIAGANDTSYAVSTAGSYTVQGAPAVCPDFIQDAGVSIVMDFHPYVQPTVQDTGILLCPEPEGISAQWYYNGSPIAGLDQCVIPIDAGNYTVFVDYGDSCSVLSAPFTVVGLNELTRSDLRASPVPTADRVSISWDTGGPIPEWRVVDQTGRTVRSGSNGTSPLAIDLGSLDVGRYRFLSGDGRSVPLAVMR